MSSEQQQRIMGYFIEEAKDHLNTIEQGLLNLQSTTEDPELISEVFRAAHSVKGGAAMLGIDSVQQMSHRLEDCFKILKERPVRVDQRLESLFLQVFDALKALIEQLQSPFGLTDQSANSIVQAVTPVVEELQVHFNQLLRSDESPSVMEGGISSDVSALSEGELSPIARRFFQADVPEHLRHMLQLFKQPDSSEGRYRLDQCCQQLLTPSRAVDLPAQWHQLVTYVQRAIAYPTNSYRQLAPIIIKNLKRAQENAVAGRAYAIDVSDDLQALLPATQDPSTQGSELDLLLAGAAFSGDSPGDSADDMAAFDDEAIAAGDGDAETGAIDEAALDDLDLFSDPDANLADVDIADIDGLADLFEAELLEPGLSEPELPEPEPSELELPELELSEPEQPEPELPELELSLDSESSDDLDILFGVGDFGDSDAEAAVEPDTQDPIADAFDAEGDVTDGDDLSTLLAMDSEPEAERLVSALSDTVDSDLDELFGDLLGGDDLESENLANENLANESLESENPEGENLGSETFERDLLESDDLSNETLESENSEGYIEATTEAQTQEAQTQEAQTQEAQTQAAESDVVPETDVTELGAIEDDAELDLSLFDSVSPDEAPPEQPSLALDDLFADFAEPSEAALELEPEFDTESELDTEPDSDIDTDLDLLAVAPDDQPPAQIVEDDFDLGLELEAQAAPSASLEDSASLESDEFSALFESTPEPSASLFDEQPDAPVAEGDSGLDGFSSLEPETGDAEASGDIEFSNDTSAADASVPDDALDFSLDAIADLEATAVEVDASPEEALGFDISTVDVTEDVWESEDNEPEWMEAIGSDAEGENPFEVSATGLEEEGLTESAESGLDELFEGLPLLDILSDSPLDIVEAQEPALGETDAMADGSDASSEDATPLEATSLQFEGEEIFEGDAPGENAPLEESVPPEESDIDANQFDALFTDFPGVAQPDSAAAEDPFSLDDLMTAEAELAPDDSAVEDDQASERLDDWAVGSSDAALSEPQEEVELSEPEPSPDEFDDLLSIGSSDSTDGAEADLADDAGLGNSPQNRSGEQRYRTEDVADDFSDLDALLGDPDADVQADLSVIDSAEYNDSAAADLASGDSSEPYDLAESDLEYIDQSLGGTEQIEAAIQELEGRGESDLSLDPLEDNAQSADDFADLEKLLEQADETLGGTPMPSTALRLASPGRRAARRPALGNQTMRVAVKNLDNLNNLVGELVVNRNSLEQSQDRLRQFLDNLMSQVQQLGDLGQRIRDLYERSLLESSLRSSRPQQTVSFVSDDQQHVTGARFDALEMDRFTGFHSLSQEIIELIVRVREAASDIDFVVDESDQGTRMLRQITTQLQEGINHTRMVPFAQAADRLPRAVRDISVKFNKQAELVVEGRDTLVDKMILEQLYDPMTHLVNNAITHGIEQPEARVAAGKPSVGKITVRAFHQGNQTIISVTDDGAGIDAHEVKQKALQRGLISPQEAETMTQLDTYDLLFHHGFSTRDQADDFAGRGVGMDVVRTSLSEVRGTVNIDSTVGRGTTFTIRLPLTLSISKALLCVSDRSRIAFPMDGVEDMFDIPQDRVQRNSAGQTCIPWRETLLPFRPLSNLLKFNRTIGRGSVYGGSQDDDMISIVVLRSTGNYLALQVDQVLEEREIVIKQLEPPVPKPAGIAGATVLGDGRVMPITDVLELVDLSLGRSRRELSREEEPPVEEPPTEEREPTVLIVDDSITVRELLSMTFAKVGYRVEQARDGQEAWEKLKSGLPCDLVFCDIEMPRMDGLELLSRLQRDPDLKALPVAMLTSRGADRHRQMAVELGAKGYFTKPYLEEALLEAAHRMLTGEALVAKSKS